MGAMNSNMYIGHLYSRERVVQPTIFRIGERRMEQLNIDLDKLVEQLGISPETFDRWKKEQLNRELMEAS